MTTCAFFRRLTALAFATMMTACSQPSGKQDLPATPIPPASTQAAIGHLYLIVTTSTRFVAEYPIKKGIPQSTPDREVTGFFAPNALTLDGAGNLYVLDYRTIKEFAPGASGHARPIRTIHVPNFLNIGTLAVDANGYVYIGQKGHVYVYAPGAHGRATPFAILKPKGYPSGLAIDASGNLNVLGTSQEMDPYRIFQTHVSVYAPPPSVKRIREFCGYEETASGIDFGIALDGKGNAFSAHTYFVNSYPFGSVQVYPAAADKCPISPSRTITTTNPVLREPVYIKVAYPYLYVCDVFYGQGGAVFTLKTTGTPQTPLSILYVENNQPHNVFDMALGP
ncbi:MAG: hypothetical protein JO078_08395 [Candidatus Eremiobacteraeota bacterium]|nr:hypothetical protein [Candidatus Eremiobacteraeota bacterium]